MMDMVRAADFADLVDGADDEPVDDVLPPLIAQDERRMQVRAYNFWASLLGNRRYPSPEALRAGAMPGFADHGVVLHFDAGLEDPAITWLGERLAQECGSDGPLARLSDVPGRSVLSRITDHYLQIVANEAPIGFEAEFVNHRGVTLLYRGILLPFSADDRTIDTIFGVINWKEVADPQTTGDLLLEIDAALSASEPRAGKAMALDAWADGPLDLAPLDLAPFALDGGADDLLPVPDFAAPPSAPEPSLAQSLETARDSAQRARASEDRTRQALYAAIGHAWDFALSALAAPADYAALIAQAGLVMQDRAPLIPLVKLVFGADYDKTRLTEYATVLGYARRIGIERGQLAGFLAETPGGLKGVIATERALRRGEDDAASEPAPDPVIALLRTLPAAPIAELPREGAEFALVVVRRMPDGAMAMVGAIEDDPALLARIARRIAP